MSGRFRGRERTRGRTGGGGLLRQPVGLFGDAVSYWTLNETTGTRYDTYHSFHLTDNGGVGSIAGKRGLAASFSGANKLTAAHSVGIDMGVTGNGATWLCWLSTTVYDQFQVFGSNSATVSFSIWLDPGGYIHGTIRGSSGTTVNIGDTTFLAVPSVPWVFAAITFNPATRVAALYLDGARVDDGSGVLAVSTLMGGTGLNIGGGVSPANYFIGKVDEAAMWDRCLTLAEIATIYASY